MPLGSTPSHPEYPAAHGCFIGAVSTILTGFFGTRRVHFSVDSQVTKTTHNFASTSDLMRQVEMARIYAGLHYHHSVIQGKLLGTKVAHQGARTVLPADAMTLNSQVPERLSGTCN